ncbi:hypothetical protein FRB90_007326, partial [Tulasnella sp. 427]
MRAGRMNADAPLRDGELCVTCPACPSPGENLPPNWQDDPLKQLHYSRFLSGDGNFKLQRVARKQSSVGSGARQRSMLGDGAFWVPEEILKRYLEVNDTSGGESSNKAGRSACNTMAGDPGYAPAGARILDVTGVFCGERFRPVDVCFSGPLNESYKAGLRYFVITYDIACKYGVNFKARCCDPSCKYVLIPTTEGEIFIAFCVNKFHQESHDDNCAAKNSLNFTKFVGRTCGEGVETIWAKLNWLQSSTREMTAGMRIEVLSEHFNDWNWQKTLGLSAYRKKYASSVASLYEAQKHLEDLKACLGDQEVRRLLLEYESAGGQQFFADPNKVTWLSRQELTNEMAMPWGSTPRGPGPSRPVEVDQVDLICKALQIEAMQAKLVQRQHDFKLIRHPLPALQAKITSLRDDIISGLELHYASLLSIAPQLNSLGLSPEEAETDEITLPSRFTPEDVDRFNLKDLLEIEMQIRIGHAYDAIGQLKQALGMRSFWSRHIKSQIGSQTKKTKGQASLQAVNARVKDAMRTYKVCWGWIVKVSPEQAASFGLRQLNDTDVRDLQEGHGQRHRILSWIWTLKPSSTGPGDLTEDAVGETMLQRVIEDWRSEFIRLDFVHSVSDVERWVEEVAIIGREMA